jgi:hypothetical protein
LLKLRNTGSGAAGEIFYVNPDGTVVVGATTGADSAKLYVSGKASTLGEMEINGDLNHDGSNVGFFGVAPASRPTVTGSRGGNAALTSFLSGISTLGLIVDSTTA